MVLPQTISTDEQRKSKEIISISGDTRTTFPPHQQLSIYSTLTILIFSFMFFSSHLACVSLVSPASSLGETKINHWVTEQPLLPTHTTVRALTFNPEKESGTSFPSSASV